MNKVIRLYMKEHAKEKRPKGFRSGAGHRKASLLSTRKMLLTQTTLKACGLFSTTLGQEVKERMSLVGTLLILGVLFLLLEIFIGRRGRTTVNVRRGTISTIHIGLALIALAILAALLRL